MWTSLGTLPTHIELPIFYHVDVNIYIYIYIYIYIWMARTIYVQCINGIFGRDLTKYTVIYGVHVRFWPTLNKCAHTYSHMHMFKQYMQTHTPDTYARICRSTHAHTHTHAHKRTHTHFAQPNITHTCTHQHPMSTCERLALVSGQASTKHFIQPDTHTHTRAHLTSPPMGTCGRLALVSGQASTAHRAKMPSSPAYASAVVIGL